MTASLTIGWSYLTGYAVATHPASREKAEWPPHPARVFMALAAAHFETGSDPAEAAALRWLEARPEPELALPARQVVFEREVVTVFVPVNDKAGPASATLQSAPAMTRSRQPRTFPRVWVGDAPCYLRWRDAQGLAQHAEALDQLCSKVTRIGHSSSLVRMWIAGGDTAELDSTASSGVAARETWVPDELAGPLQVRQPSDGTLDMLIDRYGESARVEHLRLTDRMASLKVSRKAIQGTGAKQRKSEVDEEVAALEQAAAKLAPRAPLRPTVGLSSVYRTGQTASPPGVQQSQFDTDMLVLTLDDAGRDLPLEASLAAVRALRGALMKHGVQPVPDWISGHTDAGAALETEDGHLAIVPLPFVGSSHADGHLLGLGLIFPRTIERRERGRALGPALLSTQQAPRSIRLTMGSAGVWHVQKRDWSETRQALQPETWTAAPAGAFDWASVTPVVLDRFPKSDRQKDRAAWEAEVATSIAASCERIGLPRPQWVDVGTTSWLVGSPRAIGKRRPLRGHNPAMQAGGAPLGGGFPAYPPKGAKASKPQVHVRLRFDQPIAGPLLLGAGRFLGYGFFKPLKEGR